MTSNRRRISSLAVCLCVSFSVPFRPAFTIRKGRTVVAPFWTQRRLHSLRPSALLVTEPSAVVPEDAKKYNHRAIDEMTWRMLNGTNVGEWVQSDFELMETIVEAWSHRQSSRAALVVERLLRRIVKEQMAENPYADCVDMTALYTNLIDGWANCGEIGGAERAEEILDYFQSIYEEGDSYDPLLCGPDLQSYNAVIEAYATSGREDAPQQAIRVLGKLYDLNQGSGTSVQPNKETYARTSCCALQRRVLSYQLHISHLYLCFSMHQMS